MVASPAMTATAPAAVRNATGVRSMAFTFDSEAGELRRRRPIGLAARDQIAGRHRNRIAIPQAVDAVELAVAAAVKLVERIDAVHLDSQRRQTLRRVRPRPRSRQHAVEIDVADAVE